MADPALLRDREEERLCTCGAAGTREAHEDWCDAAKDFNQPMSEADMTQDSVSDELVKIAQDAYDEFSMRAALTAIAPRLKAEGLREAAAIAADSLSLLDGVTQIHTRADALDPPPQTARRTHFSKISPVLRSGTGFFSADFTEDSAPVSHRIAALFVETDGCYFGLPDVDPWDEARDARLYAGPYPVVAHPPCQRWGRYWGGAPNKPNQYKLGDDGGCFAAALAAVRQWGGILEHPAASHAWSHFGLSKPDRAGGWVRADFDGGWTCYVEQCFYGHFSRKPTWLYAKGVELPLLRWGVGEQRIHPVALAKHGYEKARRIGVMAMVGGKDKTHIRNATPPEFRDLLISIARSARATQAPTP
jgi:hypothetical protein